MKLNLNPITIRFSALICLVLASALMSAQEFKATVKVNAPRLQNANEAVVKQTLKNQIDEFFNNTKFTDKDYEEHEKIELNVTIFVKEDPSPTSFKADVFIQSVRPVFNSDYKTQLLNFVDKDYQFDYVELQPIQNNATAYTDPLSSLLTYYAFVVLGYDFDSFSPFGGEQYFRTAQNVVDNLPSSVKDASWKPANNQQNRYNILNDNFNPKARGARQAMYDYHLRGMDIMNNDPSKGLVIVLDALNQVNEVNNIYPNSQIVRMFTDAKRDELIDVMKGGTIAQRNKAYKILTKIDPARSGQYKQILN